MANKKFTKEDYNKWHGMSERAAKIRATGRIVRFRLDLSQVPPDLYPEGQSHPPFDLQCGPEKREDMTREQAFAAKKKFMDGLAKEPARPYIRSVGVAFYNQDHCLVIGLRRELPKEINLPQEVDGVKVLVEILGEEIQALD